MVIKKRICDICGCEIIEPDNFFRFKVKSNSFITYENFDNWNPDVRRFDICRECLEELQKKLKERRMKNG